LLGSVAVARWLARFTMTDAHVDVWACLAALAVLLAAVATASALPVHRGSAIPPSAIMER
jgi:hypothetical protein